MPMEDKDTYVYKDHSIHICILRSQSGNVSCISTHRHLLIFKTNKQKSFIECIDDKTMAKKKTFQ